MTCLSLRAQPADDVGVPVLLGQSPQELPVEVLRRFQRRDEVSPDIGEPRLIRLRGSDPFQVEVVDQARKGAIERHAVRVPWRTLGLWRSGWIQSLNRSSETRRWTKRRS